MQSPVGTHSLQWFSIFRACLPEYQKEIKPGVSLPREQSLAESKCY